MMVKDCDTCGRNSNLCEVFHYADSDCKEWIQKHDGCGECIHIDDSDDSYPCNVCKGCIPYDDPRHDGAEDYFTTEYTEDVVNHPSHYTQGGIECIDAMKAAFGSKELKIYCKIAAFKYIWRMEHKNGLEDIQKAIWYLNKYIELSKEGEIHD